MAVESLFGANPTIEHPNNAEDTYTFATRITFAVAGMIVGVRFWSAATALSTSPRAAVYNTSGGSPITDQAFTGLTTGSWQTLTLSSPVSVNAGETRDIAVGPLNRYAATTGVFASPLVNGNLTGTAGRFVIGAALAFPTTTSTTWYSVDVLFQAAAQEINVGLASEVDSAHPILAHEILEVGQAAEIDSALPFTAAKSVNIGIATELDSALPMVIEGGSAGTATGGDLTPVYLANLLAGTIVNGVPTLSFLDALALWANESNTLTVVEILNREDGNTLPNWLALQGVLNSIAGTTSLTVQQALSVLADQ